MIRFRIRIFDRNPQVVLCAHHSRVFVSVCPGIGEIYFDCLVQVACCCLGSASWLFCRKSASEKEAKAAAGSPCVFPFCLAGTVTVLHSLLLDD